MRPLPLVLLVVWVLLLGACDRSPGPKRTAQSRPAATAPADPDTPQRLRQRLVRRAELAEAAASPAGARIRAFIGELDRDGVEKLRGRASLYMPYLTEGDVPGASALAVQYFAPDDFVPATVEIFDEDGTTLATAPAGRTQRRNALGAGIDDVVTVVYVVPSHHAPDDRAAARLLEREVDDHGAKISVVRLKGPMDQLRVRVKSKDGTYSNTVPVTIAPPRTEGGDPP